MNTLSERLTRIQQRHDQAEKSNSQAASLAGEALGFVPGFAIIRGRLVYEANERTAEYFREKRWPINNQSL